MPAPFWTDFIPFWDTLFLGGVQFPGAWRIEASKERSIDKAKRPGEDGYTLTNKGYNGGIVKAIGQFWRKDQLDELYSILNDFDPEFVNASSPYDVYHPSLEIIWVTQVYVRKIAVRGPTKGIYEVTLDLEQWFPETKEAKSTNKSKGGGGGFDGATTGGAPLSPEDFELGAPTL